MIICDVFDVGAGEPDMHILEDVGVRHTRKLNLHGLEFSVVAVAPSPTIVAPSAVANKCGEASCYKTDGQWTGEVSQGACVIRSDVLDVSAREPDTHILKDVGVWHTRLMGSELKKSAKV
jgi:hypothetical protein